MTETRQTVEAFIAMINLGNAEALGALMSEHHVFIDSLGNEVAGRSRMIEGWRSYFALFPDYRITVESVLTYREQALLHGSAAGTLHRDGKAVEFGHWRIPAAWRAVVEDAHVCLWQVFADNKPVYELLGSFTDKVRFPPVPAAMSARDARAC